MADSVNAATKIQKTAECTTIYNMHAKCDAAVFIVHHDGLL